MGVERGEKVGEGSLGQKCQLILLQMWQEGRSPRADAELSAG